MFDQEKRKSTQVADALSSHNDRSGRSSGIHFHCPWLGFEAGGKFLFIFVGLVIAAALFIFFVYKDGYHVLIRWIEKAFFNDENSVVVSCVRFFHFFYQS